MKILAECIDLVNIVFAAILVSFIAVLIGFHFYTEIKNKLNKKLEGKIIKLLNTDDKSKKKISRIRRIYSVNGIRVLQNVIKNIDEEQIIALKDALATEKFTKYVRTNLTFKKQAIAILTTKLIGELKLNEFTPEVLSNLKKWENHSETQQIGLLALILNNRQKELTELLSYEGFKLAISFRATQELLECFSGDKKEFFKELLTRKCDSYIHRACMYCIGNENIVELAPQVMDFLNSDNLNVRISATRALGTLKYSPAKEKLMNMLSQSEWELSCAIVEALSKIAPDECYEVILPYVFHKEWWVRYRTAETLVSLPFTNRLIEDVEKSKDSYAKEIVSYMLERKQLRRGTNG